MPHIITIEGAKEIGSGRVPLGASHLISCRGHRFPQFIREMKTMNRENCAEAKSATRRAAMATTPSRRVPSTSCAS
jgi:hypothetical protein